MKPVHLFFLLLAANPACESGTGPLVPPTRIFELVSIDGAPLPAAVHPLPGDTTLVLWATLLLDNTNHATLTTHQSHRTPPNPEVTSTYVIRNQWSLRGDSITVGFLGRCRDLCPVNSIGQLGDSTLTLTAAILPRRDPLYGYRLITAY
jgi:hypothetical protein